MWKLISRPAIFSPGADMLDSSAMQRKHSARETEMEDASGRKIGTVASRFNDDITEPMLEGALKTLSAWKVRAADTAVVYVSGSFEIPYGCLTLLKKKKFDALVAIGCIIKGETEHDRHLA